MLSLAAKPHQCTVYAELNATITIGSDVAIGHNVVFVTTDHDTSNPATDPALASIPISSKMVPGWEPA